MRRRELSGSLIIALIALGGTACGRGRTDAGLGPSEVGFANEVLAVNFSNIALTRAPLRIEFTANYEGPAPGQTVHVLTRPDLPTSAPWGPITTATQLETYLNQAWFPQELRDVNGSLQGYALIHIISFSPTDVQWELRISDNPIVQWW